MKRCRRSNRRLRGDDGAATLIAVAVIAVLIASTGAGLYVGAAVIARHRAQAAADLAALAGAGRLGAGQAAACAAATRLAAAMDAMVAECTVERLDVVVSVDAAVGLGAWDVGPARALARAGPALGHHG